MISDAPVDPLQDLQLWGALRRLGRDILAAWVRTCLETARFAEQHLGTLGKNQRRHRGSITVTFDQPSPEVCLRWKLATEGRRARVVTVPNVLAADQVAAFCRDVA